MPTFAAVSTDKLARLIGTPGCPVLIDVRADADLAADARLVPASHHRSWERAADWATQFAGSSVIVICQRGGKLSQGVAAWLREAGADAVTLEGGFDAWRQESRQLVPVAKLPARDRQGRTVWVTRARPKVDRIACPWLIRRFVDPKAVFLFVPPADVLAVADRFGATPFDVEAVHWSHRGALCTFDVMIEELGLSSEALLHLAKIVRGADTAQLDLAPEASGLLAASLGLSRMFSDDLRQLEAGLTLYDAFYRWCRDATDEKHNWPTNKPRT